MYKIVDISGFRISSTTYCMIEKIENIESGLMIYYLSFTNDFTDDTIYVFDSNNISEISKLHDILKLNGSLILLDEETGCRYLIGRKIFAFKEDVKLYDLQCYSQNPFEEKITYLQEATNLSLYDVCGNLTSVIKSIMGTE